MNNRIIYIFTYLLCGFDIWFLRFGFIVFIIYYYNNATDFITKFNCTRYYAFFFLYSAIALCSASAAKFEQCILTGGKLPSSSAT